MNAIRLAAAFFRVSAMGELAYRANFFVQLFETLLELATSVAGLFLVFSYTDAIGGWRSDEMLALVGVYFLVGGLIGLVIQPGMAQLIDSVRDGTLDFVLVKPADAQLLVSVQRMQIWKLIDVALGFSVMGIALARLGRGVGGSEAAAFAVVLTSGAVIVYSFWLILTTLAFWFVRVENILVIFQSMYEAGRWPVSLYPPWLRFGLTFIVPVAVATTVPAEAVTGRLTGATEVWAALSAALLFAASRFFWRVGLKRYSGASA
jgi:ABC-2 type transport system permease protein